MKLQHLVLALLPLGCFCCSSVRVTTADKLDVIGRTMELGGSGGELLGSFMTNDPDEPPPYEVTVHARGESFSHSLCKNVDSFEVQRGFVSVDGMNEDGLTISGHTLRQAVYQGENRSKVPIAKDGAKVCFLDFAPWALASFRSVKDLTAALSSVSVVANTIAPLPSGDRLHWSVDDASGDHVVIEYLNGEVHIHQNKVGVMTNDPDYTWHLRNLNNYGMVQSSDPQPEDLAVETEEVGSVPAVVGHGFNLGGLPGDASPPSRFVRLFYLKALAAHNRGLPANLAKGIKVVIGLLNDVWITKGTVALGKGDGPGQFEFTQYSLIKVPQKRLFHWRSYDNSQWHKIDLTKLTFKTRSSTPVNDGSDGILDVTDRLLPPTTLV